MRAILVGSLLGTVLFAACSDDEDRGEKISFSAITADQRTAMAQAAMGTLEPTLFLLASTASTSRCPSIRNAGSARLIEGGCTDERGVTWTGRLELAPWLSGGRLFLDDFGIGGEGYSFAIDGEIRSTQDGLQSDYQLVADDLTLDLELSWSIPGDQARRIDSDSVVELVGVGHAEASGQWDLSVGSGALSLTGVEVLRVDFSDLDAAGCGATTIDGAAAGHTCASDSLLDVTRATSRRPLDAFQAAARHLLAAGN